MYTKKEVIRAIILAKQGRESGSILDTLDSNNWDNMITSRDASMAVDNKAKSRIKLIKRAVCEYFLIEESDLNGHVRVKPIPFARHIFMYLCNE